MATGRPRAQSWRAHLRIAADDCRTAAARAALQLTFVANESAERLHAVGVTLIRLTVTRRRLLFAHYF